MRELIKRLEAVLRVLTRAQTKRTYVREGFTRIEGIYRPPLPKPQTRRFPPLSDVTTTTRSLVGGDPW